MEDTGKMDLPFSEVKIGENIYLRKFFQNADCGEFTWHRDREDRIVQSTQLTDWKIQIDNELPKSLNEEVKIPMGVWHRIIKGNNDMEIKLIKLTS
jgi:hypothetical protein